MLLWQNRDLLARLQFDDAESKRHFGELRKVRCDRGCRTACRTSGAHVVWLSWVRNSPRVDLFTHPAFRWQLTAELQQLKTALREERRKNDKLQLSLEIEKEANAQAQRVIEGIRNLDTSDFSDGDS